MIILCSSCQIQSIKNVISFYTTYQLFIDTEHRKKPKKIKLNNEPETNTSSTEQILKIDVSHTKNIHLKENLPEILLDYPRSIKILDIENPNYYIPFRNELAMGLNILIGRKIKLFKHTCIEDVGLHRYNMVNATLDIECFLENSSISSAKSNIHVPIKYKKTQDESWLKSINFDHIDDTIDVFLSQNVCIVDIRLSNYNKLIQNETIDNHQLTYQMLMKGKNHIWPVLVLNPIYGKINWINSMQLLQKINEEENLLHNYVVESKLNENEDEFTADKANISSSNFDSILHTPDKQAQVLINNLIPVDVIKIDSDSDNTKEKVDVSTEVKPENDLGKRIIEEEDDKFIENFSKEENDLSEDSNLEDFLKDDFDEDIKHEFFEKPDEITYVTLKNIENNTANEPIKIDDSIELNKNNRSEELNENELKIDDAVLEIIDDKGIQIIPNMMRSEIPELLKYEDQTQASLLLRTTRTGSIQIEPNANVAEIKKTISARAKFDQELAKDQRKDYAIIWYIGTNYYEV